jgi:hypothetical protein
VIYKGTFIKANGEERTMLFKFLSDLTEEDKSSLSQTETRHTQIPPKFHIFDQSELVFDCEKKSFRLFNWKTLKGSVEAINME